MLAWPEWHAHSDVLRELILSVNPSLQQTLLDERPVLGEIMHSPGRVVTQWSHAMAEGQAEAKSR